MHGNCVFFNDISFQNTRVDFVPNKTDSNGQLEGICLSCISCIFYSYSVLLRKHHDFEAKTQCLSTLADVSFIFEFLIKFYIY